MYQTRHYQQRQNLNRINRRNRRNRTIYPRCQRRVRSNNQDILDRISRLPQQSIHNHLFADDKIHQIIGFFNGTSFP